MKHKTLMWNYFTWITTAKIPAIITPAWKKSVQITAFIPPCDTKKTDIGYFDSEKKTIKIDPNFLFRNSFYQYENYKYKLNNIYDLRLEWKTNKRIFGIAQNGTKFFLIVFCSSLFRYNTQFNDWLTTNILFWWKYMLNHKMFCWG